MSSRHPNRRATSPSLQEKWKLSFCVSSIAGFPAHAVPAYAISNTDSFMSLSGASVGGRRTHSSWDRRSPLRVPMGPLQADHAVLAAAPSFPTQPAFSPVGANVTQGQTYVEFPSTYELANDSGLAIVGSVCLRPPHAAQTAYGGLLCPRENGEQVWCSNRDYRPNPIDRGAPKTGIPQRNMTNGLQPVHTNKIITAILTLFYPYTLTGLRNWPTRNTRLK